MDLHRGSPSNFFPFSMLWFTIPKPDNLQTYYSMEIEWRERESLSTHYVKLLWLLIGTYALRAVWAAEQEYQFGMVFFVCLVS